MPPDYAQCLSRIGNAVSQQRHTQCCAKNELEMERMRRSVARCLVPHLKRSCPRDLVQFKALQLSSDCNWSIVIICNYFDGPIRWYHAERKYCLSMHVDPISPPKPHNVVRMMVEARGTAPRSATPIAQPIYRHRAKLTKDYRRYKCQTQGDLKKAQ